MLVKNGVCFADGRFTRADVRLHGGKIAAVGQLEAEPGEEVQDAAGLFVLPGFVDIHIHAFGGADCMRGEADVRRMSDGLLETGVAAFVPTTMSAWPEQTYEALCGIQAVMDRPQPRGAAVLGAHMEAPFLSPKYKGAQLEACLSLPSAEAYEAMVRGLSCVRMMTLAPELPGAGPLIAYLKARGVVTCAAHSAASAAQVHAAADAGLSQITHLFNAQTPLHHREPGVPGAGLADERILVQVIADGIHLHPDVLRIAALCKGERGVALISDSMEAAGLPDGRYELGGQAVTVKDGAARLENGVLAGSTLLLHQAVQNMITLAHVPPEKVIPMATSTPADSIGAKGYGRLAPGYAGVLALMDAQWRFAGVLA
ncbi:MAG TPA: N-acetylglucosamine-6-phosphate deacetylase [Candidatus Ventricola intestinavium]|nr:N-acetylglucosamine-6-phosphate deacetylase [Candidatus Ventricola intestinavium]